MGTPQNIKDCASPRFYPNKESARYHALSIIAELTHPQRPFLSSFIDAAAEPETAAQYFLKTAGQKDSALFTFIVNWTRLVEKGEFRFANGDPPMAAELY
jgi:hypothetical protein